MDFIAGIPVVSPVLSFVIGLSIIIAIHELGHLMVGRWCGIRAEVFSIGFGKALWSRTDRQGTRWQIAWVPLGGYVKFVGDMDPASAGKANDEAIPPEQRRHAFHNAGLLARTLTVLAGPMANFLLALALFFAIAMTGQTASDKPVVAAIDAGATGKITGLEAGDRVLAIDGQPVAHFAEILQQLSTAQGQPVPALVERGGAEVETEIRYDRPPLVSAITVGNAGFEAGIRPGDRLLSIDGQPIASAGEVQEIVRNLDTTAPHDFTIRRGDEKMVLTVTPELVDRPDPVTGEPVPTPFLGIGMQDTGVMPLLVPASVGDAAQFAVYRLWRIIADTTLYLKEIALGGADASELSGPVGIAKVLSVAADHGISDYLTVVAFLSVAIGFFNLLPIPVLDGGHLMFYLVEAIRGRPNNEAVVRYGTAVGLSLLLLLMVYVTFNNDLGLGAWFAQR